jgi:ribosomal protein S18 acetylase RimI-like enzyme
MMVLSGEGIDQLYVRPGHQRRGHGSRLVTFAQGRRTELQLNAFESNHPARALRRLFI